MQKRRDLINIIAENSLLSIADIATFFNVPEYCIQIDIQYLQYDKDIFPQEINSIVLQTLLDKRQNYIEKMIQSGIIIDEILPSLGMYSLPTPEKVFQHEEEKFLYTNGSILELANHYGYTQNMMTRHLRKKGIDAKAVIKEGESFRKQQLTEQLKILLMEGVDAKVASAVLNFSQHVGERTATTLYKELKDNGYINATNHLRFSHKTADRRKQIFELYKNGLTQQEIADKLKISRATVAADMRLYLKEHPEERDKTILWQQRNLQEDKRKNRQIRKSNAILLRECGLTPTKIAQVLKEDEPTVRKFLDEAGLLGERVSDRRIIVNSLIEQDVDAKKIAKQLGYPLSLIMSDIADLTRIKQEYGLIIENPDVKERRSEELRLAWQGAKTSEIMIVMGRSRTSVLNDQHITSNFLRNHPDALEYVSVRNGGVKQNPLEEDFELQ